MPGRAMRGGADIDIHDMVGCVLQIMRRWMPLAADDDEQSAPKRPHAREMPLETAARLRAEFGIQLSKQAREPLPRSVYDELSGDD